MARRSTAARAWRWCRVHPKSSGLGLAVLVTLFVVGSTGDHHTRDDAATAPPTTTSVQQGTAQSSTSTSTPAPSGVDQRSGSLATAVLAGLAVKGRAPRTGYDRAQFGTAWTDDNGSPLGHNGCDTRNDVLRRDLGSVVLKPDSNGCAVLTGKLQDPYTGRSIAFDRLTDASGVQIDHVVALSDAWQTGAQRFDLQTRTDFANDPLNLLAVDGSTNESKGDGDAASWLPPNKAYRCAYVARQIAVKVRYGLWMTVAERDAAQAILDRCPAQVAPTETQPAHLVLAPAPSLHVAPKSTPTPTPTPTPTERTSHSPAPVATHVGCTTTSSGNCIRGGQLCPQDSYGRTGIDADGDRYVCKGDSDHPHWEQP